MTDSERRTIKVLLMEEHLREMVDEHLLAEDETGDTAKIARVVRRLLDGALGLPQVEEPAGVERLAALAPSSSSLPILRGAVVTTLIE